MGDMKRSDLMVYCNVFIQPECAFEIISQFGELGCALFVDVTPETAPYHRNYITEVCRCAEMERKLRSLKTEIEKDNIQIVPIVDIPKPLQPNEMLYYENIIGQWANDIKESADNQILLNKRYLELDEMRYVLESLEPLLGRSDFGQNQFGSTKKRGTGDFQDSSGQLLMVTGVVRRTKCMTFQLMLWRISKGNVYFRQGKVDQEFVDPVSGKKVLKVAFLAVCQGKELKSRVDKICSAFRVNIYKVPDTYDARQDLALKLEARASDLATVLKTSNYFRCKALLNICGKYMNMYMQIRKTEAIFHTMNLFSLDITKNCLLGQCWVSTKDLAKMQQICSTVSAQKGAKIDSFIMQTATSCTPPTYHRTNKFTDGFQALINAYGDSQYRELNPGLYTVITFPFLFSLMFSDWGHGILITVVSFWMVYNEDKFIKQNSTNEIWNMFFGGRYIILLMGLFSIYAGLMYNDFFGIGLSFTDPYWRNHYSTDEIAQHEHFDVDPALETGNVYYLGIDPLWKVADNTIIFENSLKMKLSIIVGVIHMMFGLLLSLFNHLHFKRYYAIFFEFIPQMLFLTCLFFWLVVMMFMKWFMFSAKSKDVTSSTSCAPLILILFIDMMMFKTTKPVDEGCNAYLFDEQQIVQYVLVITSLLCIPIMLFGSPCYLNQRNKKKLLDLEHEIRQIEYERGDSHISPHELDLKQQLKTLKEQKLGEILIYQSVHTIEFVLSTISHTASYLRLWALSLAHAQLSEMLWLMVLAKMSLMDHSKIGAIKVFIFFSVWAFFTLAILVIMEGLSAFLHTLRLHWVEFMSKFYQGGGHPFNPFSFKTICFVSSDSIDDTMIDRVCSHPGDKEHRV